jgi:hypothetical protein
MFSANALAAFEMRRLGALLVVVLPCLAITHWVAFQYGEKCEHDAAIKHYQPYVDFYVQKSVNEQIEAINALNERGIDARISSPTHIPLLHEIANPPRDPRRPERDPFLGSPPRAEVTPEMVKKLSILTNGFVVDEADEPPPAIPAPTRIYREHEYAMRLGRVEIWRDADTGQKFFIHDARVSVTPAGK